MRHTHTVRDPVHTPAPAPAGEWRYVAGQRCPRCRVACSRLRCGEVLCCGCPLMRMPSELEDDSPLEPPARAAHSRAEGPCPPDLRPGAQMPGPCPCRCAGRPQPPFHLPKLMLPSIFVHCTVRSVVIDDFILLCIKPYGASMQMVWPARNLRIVKYGLAVYVSYKSRSCAES